MAAQETTSTPDGRIQLAISILNHRDWCETCKTSADHVQAALDGKSIEEIAGGE